MSGKQKLPGSSTRRGASRAVANKEPSKPKIKLRVSWLKHIPWSVLTVVMLVSGFVYSSIFLGKEFYAFLDQPIRNVVVSGDVDHVNVAALKERIMESGKLGFITSDMERLRIEAEALGWVKTVTVTRFWPYGVELSLTEHTPVARWGTKSLLSADGEVFEVNDSSKFQNLPVLHGALGQELELMATYSDLNRQLAAAGLIIESLKQSSRGAWQLVCRNRLKLNLGRDRVNEKISKFVTVFKLSLHKQVEQIEQVDLRYTNGLAVAWKAPKKELKGKSQLKVGS